ncbi:MAG: leucine-rich repeat domain-containing protein [Verrucomicrobia bacterium]|nr:leucine-rich repeat domain-containing protein [Verrucomicrobiota bacterium]
MNQTSPWDRMPLELVQQVAHNLGDRSSMSRVNHDSKRAVNASRVDDLRRQISITAAYNSQSPSNPQCDQYFLERAQSLARKTQGLFGGRAVIRRSLEDDQSLLDPDVQLRLARAGWGSKAESLIALVKQAEGGEEFLQDQVYPLNSDRERVLAMAKQIPFLQFPDQLSIIRLVHSQANQPWNHLNGAKQLTYFPAAISLIQSREFILTNNSLNQNSFHPNAVPPQIRKLELSFNTLEAVPQAVGKMRTLTSLGMASQRSPLALPENSPLWDLDRLEELDLSSNNLESLPPQLARLERLIKLDLPYNGLTDVPNAILDLPNLSVLRLDHNPIPFDKIKLFIQQKIERGLQVPLTIQINPDVDAAVALSNEIHDQGEYTLTYSNYPPTLVLEKRDIEMTQPLD